MKSDWRGREGGGWNKFPTFSIGLKNSEHEHALTESLFHGKEILIWILEMSFDDEMDTMKFVSKFFQYFYAASSSNILNQ